MRIFGYGSLMWGGWEKDRGCISTNRASLSGYRRSFNKASVKNWGTHDYPGPTLSLIQDDASTCLGLVFEFPDLSQHTIKEYLGEREGKAFDLEECKVVLDSGEEVMAYVPIYHGRNILRESIEALAARAIVAEGKSGKCADYVISIDSRLRLLDLQDAEVSRMAKLVKSELNTVERL